MFQPKTGTRWRRRGTPHRQPQTRILLGPSQGDIAALKGEDLDWTNYTVSFFRKKTGVPVLVHLGNDALNLLKDLPSEGTLFPYLSRVRAGDRAR